MKTFDLVLKLDADAPIISPAQRTADGAVVVPGVEYDDGTIDCAAVADTDTAGAIKAALKAERARRTKARNANAPEKAGS